MIIFINESDTLTKDEIKLYNNLLIKEDLNEISLEEHNKLQELSKKHYTKIRFGAETKANPAQVKKPP